MFRNLLILTATFMVILAIIFTCMAVTNTPEASPTTPSPSTQTNETIPDIGLELPMVQLDGEWMAENNGTRFVATVSNQIINIQLVSDGVSMTYWNGTFGISESPGTTVTSSVVDINKMVLSAATSKDFVVGDHTLSFEFQGMGIKATVVMIRV